MTAFRRLLCARGGNVTIEAALAFTVISTLLIGGADFGRLVLRQSQLEQVVRAGTQYGLRGQTDALDTQAVVAAALAAGGQGSSGMNVTAQTTCHCPGQGGISCNGTCTDDSYPQMYLNVSAGAEVTFLFGLAGAPKKSISALKTLRVR